MQEQSMRTSAVITGSSRLRAENRLPWRSMSEDVRPNHVTVMVMRLYGKGWRNEVSDPAQIPPSTTNAIIGKVFHSNVSRPAQLLACRIAGPPPAKRWEDRTERRRSGEAALRDTL